MKLDEVGWIGWIEMFIVVVWMNYGAIQMM
jgi:hypothetical protein